MITIRHERALVMVATYAIGFSTAFIAFGVAQTKIEDQAAVVYYAGSTTAEVVEEVETTAEDIPAPVILPPQSTNESEEELQIEYKEGRLELTSGAEKVLLSFNPEITGIDLTDIKGQQGYHYGELHFSLFDFGKYVFFCEQKIVDDTECTPYLYDTVNAKVLALTHHNKPITVDISEAKEAVFDIGGLTIGNYYSISATAPQVLVLAGEEIDLQVQ